MDRKTSFFHWNSLHFSHMLYLDYWTQSIVSFVLLSIFFFSPSCLRCCNWKKKKNIVWGATLLIGGFMAWLEENWKMDKVFHFDLIGALLMLGCLWMMFFQDWHILVVRLLCGVGGGGGCVYMCGKKKLSTLIVLL
jgi:hypothetical protein